MALIEEEDWLLKEEEDRLIKDEKDKVEQHHDGAWYRSVSKEKLLLGIYVVLVVLVGTGNRVSFKLMQYSIINYTYFVSQLTTFIYIPVNGFVLIMKLLFTNDITPEMKAFPKKKFLVMGFLDSLAGLLIVVGGRHVPGIMQNLLLQGTVVITMLFSLLLLRPKGCQQCGKLRKELEDRGVKYKEIPCYGECTEDTCCASVAVGEVRWSAVQTADDDMQGIENYLSNANVDTEVMLLTSGKPWSEHLKTYYSIPQYVGAAIIMGGLVFSVWPALTGTACGESNPAGPPFADLLFFCTTVPTALSAVYKEIAFKKVDLDVWLVNFWVSVFQFSCGLTYAPLAAVMSGLAVVDIPQNLWRGLLCFLIGENFVGNEVVGASSCPDGVCQPLDIGICPPVCDVGGPLIEEFSYCSPVDLFSDGTDYMGDDTDSWGVDCGAQYYYACDPLIDPYTCVMDACGYSSIENITVYGAGGDEADGSCYPYCTEVCASPDSACLNCGVGGDSGTCCDSCDGSVACLSSMSALAAVFLYMAFNIAYNTLLLLVIKHGSAALMYVASTIVLPLGGVAFTLPFLLGPHATQFTLFNGVGLLIVLAGLITYRFVGSRPRKKVEVVGGDLADAGVGFSLVGQKMYEEESDLEVVEVTPGRTGIQMRRGYYDRLGIGGQPPSDRENMRDLEEQFAS